MREIKSTLKKEYKEAIKFLPRRARYSYTRPLYLWAYAIFTSRSFRPSLVLPETESMALPCAIDDFSVLLPLYDLGNHSPTARASWTADYSSQLVSLRCGDAYESGQQVFNVSRKKKRKRKRNESEESGPQQLVTDLMSMSTGKWLI